MDFFSIDSSSKGWISTLPSLRFIWTYFCGVATTTIAVFSWWGYKYYALTSAQKPAPGTGEEGPNNGGNETNANIHGLLDRRTGAAREAEELAAALKELAKQKDPDGQNEAAMIEDKAETQRKNEELQTQLFTKLLYAIRERETGVGNNE